MLFNSFDYAIFVPLVFALYWFIFNKNIHFRNTFLLICSYIFYGWWNWRFLFLIMLSSTVDYFAGVGLEKTNAVNKRKLLLLTSITINLGVLAFFKYYNFFADSFTMLFEMLGFKAHAVTLNILLPVGISFYTFQSMSYTIDVYNRKMKPVRNAVTYFSFVSFFPQLVAGPIERATHLIPQFQSMREFDYSKAAGGLRMILWGLFKKIAVADNCAGSVNQIFEHYMTLSGSTLLLGAVLFAFQIYCDFSGYSDIAIGTARLFGFDLMRNFATPYFSRDIAEFWRRWHISLSTWFRDYVYIPLGGSRVSNILKIRNTFIVFVVSGFWHGANWTFLAWGFLHALYFIPLLLLKLNRKNTGNLPTHVAGLSEKFKEFSGIFGTFFLVVIAWIFFRADNISIAIKYIQRIFSASFFTIPQMKPSQAVIPIVVLIVVEWITRNKSYEFEMDRIVFSRPLRWALYSFIGYLIIIFPGESQKFIYFQF